MRYYVTLPPSGSAAEAAPPIEIDVTELPSGELRVHVGGEPVTVDVVSLSWSGGSSGSDAARGGSSGALSVRIDGQLVDLTTEGTPPEVGVIANGHRAYVRVVSERLRAAEAAKKGGARANEKVVKSPMPGRVVKVLVAKGDAVTTGQPLLIIEAMKMENELRAKAPGTVAEVHASPGTAVEANAKLVTFA